MPNTDSLLFSAQQGWMNDPNGLIFHKGKYHLFYQHNPFANAFGNISWGHAVSEDLYHWEHLPVALPASKGKMIFSGCVVFDEQNSFGHNDGPALVAVYTEHLYESEDVYEQKIAYATSHDEGLTWDMSHPERLAHSSSKDFRDPKVFWYAPEAKWVMLVALSLEYRIEFYESTDLKSWTKTSSFTADTPNDHSWECPDLFPLKDEHGNEHWILSLSGDHPDGKGWGMFYFVGDFDGKGFRASSSSSGSSLRENSRSESSYLSTGTSAQVFGDYEQNTSESYASDSEGLRMHQWLNHGHDFYAGICFEGLQDRIMMAWCGNWAYAQELPKQGRRSKMSLPRKLSFKSGSLIQEPVLTQALKKYVTFSGDINKTQQFELTNEGGEKSRLSIGRGGLEFDRSACQAFADYKDYQILRYKHPIHQALIISSQGILEMFLNNGQYVLTEQY